MQVTEEGLLVISDASGNAVYVVRKDPATGNPSFLQVSVLSMEETKEMVGDIIGVVSHENKRE